MQIPNLVSLLETTAVITTVFQYLSGAIVCHKYMQKKSTGDSSGFPFICGFLSCSLWLRYGCFTNEQTIAFVNIIGAMLFFMYAVLYYIFTVNKKPYLKQFSAVLLILLAVILYTNQETDNDKAVKIMGIVCCIVTVGFFAAPLTMLMHVIRVKNSESLPFPLISMSFLVSLQWLIYGVIISDSFIQIPNFLGCMLSILQLCLFVVYPPKTFSGQAYKLVDQTVIY
ncbi:sugar transporter SWEET1 [Teleopsis dalmanni]|uniref:sugar transporter SWEET1 n=1 Tax=Teleopsis dalmanni TaxID=139649 RepID=UPI0018CDF920|nr:sugar transporter SWEET1 [Teleopsis dalmanni]